MKLERKIYETHSQKIGDFFLGIVLFILVSVGIVRFIYVTSIFFVILGQISSNLFFYIIFVMLFLVHIGLLIYFGLTRYWVALGMLVGFVVCLLLVLVYVVPVFQAFEEFCRTPC